MSQKKRNEVDFIYQKTPTYKNYHADGVFGGITPGGYLHLGFFLERNPIPQKIKMEINPDSTLGKEISQEGKKGIIREFECGVIIDLKTAKKIEKWLKDFIEKHERIFPKSDIRPKENKK